MIIAISAPVTEASKEIVLERVFYIYYSIQFKKDKVKTLINSGSKVNAILSGYTSKLGLKFHFIDVRTQKMNSSTFKRFDIVIGSFQIEDKPDRPQYF